MKKIHLLALILTILSIAKGQGQDKETKNEFGVLFGLSQPILGGGFNYELNYFTKHLVFDWSHGIALRMQGAGIVGDMKTQKLVAYIPHTLGFGFGYRFTNWLNLRLEPKLHIFRINYDGEINNTSSKIAEYKTFTLGLGLYGKWMPFKNKLSAIKGIILAPSIRYWPNINSSLIQNKVDYANKFSEKIETHRAMNIGFNNTPLILNISLGYVFQSKK